jgi:hypothetical protein
MAPTRKLVSHVTDADLADRPLIQSEEACLKEVTLFVSV